MSLENLLGAKAELRPMLELWQMLAPVRDKLKGIDWQKLKEQIQKIMPVILAILDLLPKTA